MAPHLQGWPLRFHPLAFLEDGGEVVVGRSDIDSVRRLPARRGGAGPRAGGRTSARRTRRTGTPTPSASASTCRASWRRCTNCGSSAPRTSPRSPRPRRCAGRRLGRALFSAPAWVALRRRAVRRRRGVRARPRMLPRVEQRVLHRLARHRRGGGLRRAARADPRARGVPRAGRSPPRHPQPPPDLAAPVLRRLRDRTSTGSRSSSAGSATCRSWPGWWRTRWPWPG